MGKCANSATLSITVEYIQLPIVALNSEPRLKFLSDFVYVLENVVLPLLIYKYKPLEVCNL